MSGYCRNCTHWDRKGGTARPCSLIGSYDYRLAVLDGGPGGEPSIATHADFGCVGWGAINHDAESLQGKLDAIAGAMGKEYTRLMNLLCCAYFKAHGPCTRIRQRLPGGDEVEYLESGGPVVQYGDAPGLAENIEANAALYWQETSIPPEECAVVQRREPLTIRFERWTSERRVPAER